MLGYALGTAQILIIDWSKTRSLHRRHLRLIRAELRRVASLNSRYNWKGKVPFGPAVRFPRPPSVSPAFIDTITATEFTLTDEHDDDNSQEALLGVLDGCDNLQSMNNRIQQLIDEINSEVRDDRRDFSSEAAIALTERYDSDVGRLEFSLTDALRDVERRLSDTRFRQLIRTLRGLPKGENPPALVHGDPRLRAGNQSTSPPSDAS